MAQQFLNGPQVRASAEHVGRKGVPESVRMNLQLLRKPADMMIDNMPDAPAGQPPAPVTQKKRFPGGLAPC